MSKLVSKIKKLKNNQGNSFVVVVATVSFLAILTAALLVAVALIYRLKAYDINSKDNFYYLEQAMDEIYAGVGADSMGILNEAYDDTLETLVYYDTDAKQYKTMTNEQANAMLKKTYIYLLQNNENYSSTTKVDTRLRSFLSNPYDVDSNPEGIQLSFNTIEKNDLDLTIVNVVLKREAEYSTVNARAAKNATGKDVAAGDTFIQSITTDIVIGAPAFAVNFNSNATELNELYEYSMIADMGIEITSADGKAARGDKVALTGNIYAASDFYNKKYNEDPGTIHWQGTTTTDTIKTDQIQKVNSYDSARLLDCDGVKTKSAYSGLYIDGANVTIASDRLIIPGTLAVMNSGDVAMASISSSSDTWTEVWADGIVLDGYSLKKNLEGDLKGSSLYMRANLYMYDDLEVNANSAQVTLDGEYYGYNYASTDNRTYSETALANGTRTFTARTSSGYKDGKGIEGQAHYNSSAIILNGQNANLNFEDVKTMYVAGQSYIELSKQTTTTDEAITYNVEATTVDDTVQIKSNDYASKSTVNYTTTNNTSSTPIQDYRTGEAISVKSNQLAYIPNTNVIEDETGIYVNLPASLKTLEPFKDFWEDLSHVPVIKTVISGKAYYFYDFSSVKPSTPDKEIAMNTFIEAYAELFSEDTITAGPGGVVTDDRTTGEKANLQNITDYDFFQVEALNVDTDEKNTMIYTNSAITTKVGNKFSIKANQKNMEALTTAASRLSADSVNTVAAANNAQDLTKAFNQQYKEAKWLLTNKSATGEYVTEAHALAEDCITPINHYFDFSKVNSENTKYIDLESGYGVWVSEGDVKVGANSFSLNGGSSKNYDRSYKNGKVRGIIIAKGDVTFDTDVKEFEGLVVTGGKIIINNFTGTKTTMALSANAEIIKSVLRECDASRGETAEKNYGFVCDTFRLFESTYEPPSESDDNVITAMKSISAVQFEDIISLKNWVRNVD